MWMWNGCQTLVALRTTHSSFVLSWTVWSSRLASKISWSIKKMVAGGLIGGPNWKVIWRLLLIAAVERSSNGSSVVGSGWGVTGSPSTTSVARVASGWVLKPVAMESV